MSLNNVSSGSNPGCGTSGFSAVEGWDPVTSFGKPDFLKLQDPFVWSDSQYPVNTVAGF
jgi:hypothetical protein